MKTITKISIEYRPSETFPAVPWEVVMWSSAGKKTKYLRTLPEALIWINAEAIEQ